MNVFDGSFILSAFLFLILVQSSFLQKRSRKYIFFVTINVFFYLVLNLFSVAYVFFTGAIDNALLFHVYYGVGYGKLSEYSAIIIYGILFFSIVFILSHAFYRKAIKSSYLKDRNRYGFFKVTAGVCVAGAFYFHPTTTALTEIIVYGQSASFIEALKSKKNGSVSFIPGNSYTTLSPYDFSTDVNRFIAHAAGMIEGNTYTNSLEALELNYRNGFRVFELDIMETSDNTYVAVHDWDDWKKGTGYRGDLPPTAEVFKEYKILTKYTALNMDDINRWFEKHPDAVLVTDKVNRPIDFSSKFVDKKRLIMELFTREALNEGLQCGIKSAMPTWNLVKKMKMLPTALDAAGITVVAASRRVIVGNRKFFGDLKKLGIKTFVFHINQDTDKDESYVLCNEREYIYGMYADKWSFSGEQAQLCN